MLFAQRGLHVLDYAVSGVEAIQAKGNAVR